MTPSRFFTATPWILASLWLLAACGPKEKAPAPAPLPLPSTSYQTLDEVPQGTRDEVDAFAKALEQHLKSKQVPEIKSSFDLAAVADRICHGLTASEDTMQKFRSGLIEGLRTNLTFLASTWSGQEVKYKGLTIHRGTLTARFRFIAPDGGISLIDYTVEKNSRGKAGIVDFYNQALGMSLVDQGRQSAIPVMAELDKGFLERLAGGSNATLKDMELMGQMSAKFRNKDFAGSIADYRKLPPSMQNQMSAIAIYISALQQAGDDEGYKAALKKAGTNKDSSNFQFMLVDLYVLEKDLPKAVASLNDFLAAVGDDAALLALKALLLSGDGKHDQAVATLRQAIALEPDCKYVQVNSLDVYLGARDFPAVAQAIRQLEQGGEMNFKGALTGPIWEEFLKAPESLPWR